MNVHSLSNAGNTLKQGSGQTSLRLTSRRSDGLLDECARPLDHFRDSHLSVLRDFPVSAPLSDRGFRRAGLGRAPALAARAGLSQLIVCHLDHGLRGRAGGPMRASSSVWPRRTQLPSNRNAPMSARAPRKTSSRSKPRRAQARSGIFRGGRAAAALPDDFSRASRGRSGGDVSFQSLSRQRGRRAASDPRGVRSAGHGRELTLVRPLLGVWREEIDALCGTHTACVSAKTSAIARSTPPAIVLRHRVIPWLEKEFGRDVRREPLARRGDRRRRTRRAGRDDAVRSGAECAGPADRAAAARDSALAARARSRGHWLSI